MENREWKWMDKSKWGPGQWQDEPDKVQWTDETTGLPCLAVRDVSHGAWCGYVGVSPGHPYFEKHYNEVGVDCHGGLTYAAHCQEHCDRQDGGVCHIVTPGEPDNVWWLGFDCVHHDDYEPAYNAIPEMRGLSRHGSYRDLEYVKGNCRSLAWQLVEAAKPRTHCTAF